MNRMLSFAVLLASVVAVFAQDDSCDKRKKQPKTRSGGHEICWTSYGASARLTFDREKQSFLFKAIGVYEPPKGGDFLAVRKVMKPKSAQSGGGDILIERTFVENEWDFSPIGVSVFLQALLKEDAYTLKSVPFEVKVLERLSQNESFTLPSTVNEEFREFSSRLKLRIKSLQMTSSRLLTVGILYERDVPGPGAPFVVAFRAIDKNGKKLGEEEKWGAKWNPLRRRGTLSAVFRLGPDDRHVGFGFTIVTKARVKKVNFVAKDIFRK